MDAIALVLLWLHLLGFAALLGGCLVQWGDKQPWINDLMFYGAMAQFVTGVALFAVLLGTQHEPNHFKMGAKFLLLLLIAGLCVLNRRRVAIPQGLWAILTVMVVAESAIAVLWR